MRSGLWLAEMGGLEPEELGMEPFLLGICIRPPAAIHAVPF